MPPNFRSRLAPTGSTPVGPTKRLLPTRGLRVRYGNKSARTIARWVKAGVLPGPDITINGQYFWWESTLESHERAGVLGKAAAKA